MWLQNGGGYANCLLSENSEDLTGAQQQPEPAGVDFSWLLKEMHEKLETLGNLSETIESKSDAYVDMGYGDGTIMPLSYNVASPLYSDFTRLTEPRTSELRFDSEYEHRVQDPGGVLLHHHPHTEIEQMRTCHLNGERPFQDSPTSVSHVLRDGSEELNEQEGCGEVHDEAAPPNMAEGDKQGEASEVVVHLQHHLSAMSEAVELLANLEESERTSPSSHFPSMREHECDSSTILRDVSDGSRSESASSSILGLGREGLVRRVRHHLASVSQQVGALEGKLEDVGVKKKVETRKGGCKIVSALFVVSLSAALMVLITNFYLEIFVEVSGPPPT